MQTYLEKNDAYWAKGYAAENVESFVFRPYGRVLKFEFGLDGTHGEKLLDFGCGQGAALNFFKSKGFDVYGVDISETDISCCREQMADVADQFEVVDPSPETTDCFFGGEFDVVIGIQAFYYYSDKDLQTRLQSIYNMMKPGGVIYASMIGPGHYLYDHATETENGLSRVEVNLPRIQVQDYYINFTHSKEQLIDRFSLWEKKHVGYYDAQFREDEGGSFHYTFIGQKT